MKTTIFNTPILSTIFHVLARIFMRLSGWRVEGKLPDIPKFVPIWTVLFLPCMTAITMGIPALLAM